MFEGTVLKGYSGFYYVKYNQQIYECSLRGKNRIKKIKFLPGDKVTFEPISQEKGVIEDLLPRKNELIRPPIANVEQVIIVSSLVNPEPDLWLLDRLTILALWNDIKPILCLNKADLSSQEKIANLKKIYEQAKFKVLVTSAKKNLGIDDLKGVLKDQISVVAGASGVGKSSILNAIQPDLRLQIGEVSLKLKRGKHTTRHVELIPLHFGGLVADTPGFSSLNLPEDIMREQLSFLFPDFDQYRNNCKFSTCLHKEEPECSVREAVQKGELAQNRYNNYLAFLEEVIKQERSY
ncbi:MAG: ribosome biosis GTPase / thiamine phosphate phosphatase [Clostridia bacterium]|jgi:ribosome biogenesis GTPase|nr:ribosome biosis GTPase / thiamine phosphate phosphatase [Clostridia bacterium]MDN5322245.1 ribosome biosis GTPase / thiamine phosphate phosphatase [Clostridia bacterium]